MHDIKIINGEIIDGSGGQPYRGEVAIRDGRILEMGASISGDAEQAIDACGHVVSPGFIDLHNHSGAGTVMNFLQQGVTTIVTGNCGFDLGEISDLETKCKEAPCGPNVLAFVGHNTVRTRVIGRDDRPATAEEMALMKQEVARAMQDGAIGFSTGLAYVPGMYTTTEEVIELAKVAAEYGGFYATHMRNAGRELMDSLKESARIGREAGLPVQISHMKSFGAENWGQGTEAMTALDTARAAGIDVTCDQYPYAASCARIQLMCPAWLIEGDADRIRARLNNPTQRGKAREELVALLGRDYEGDATRIVVASCEHDESMQGKNLRELSVARGGSTSVADAAEMALCLLEAAPADRTIMCVYHSMSEKDIVTIMQSPYTAIASDGWYVDFGDGVPHPRSYGTFPRVLGRYCREKKLFPIEEAVRKMTSLPAGRLRLPDRGILKQGACADLTIFDKDAVADTATYDQPHQYPIGIDYVIVNGKITLDHGNETGAFAGRFLRRPQ